jgi:hypothetical protein
MEATEEPEAEYVSIRCGDILCLLEKCIIPRFNSIEWYANTTLRPIAGTKPLILEIISVPDNGFCQLHRYLYRCSDSSQVVQKDSAEAAASPVVYHLVHLFL